VLPLSCRSFDPASVTIGKQLGEGSFGVVFEGSIGDKRGAKQGGAGTRVILKKVKSKVLGAEEMRTSELYFNQRLQRTARGSCAEFLGTVQVDKYTQKGKLVEVSRRVAPCHDHVRIPQPKLMLVPGSLAMRSACCPTHGAHPT
jgi:hypothetical protein